MLDIPLAAPGIRINYKDKLLVAGSCFTEHIGDNLAALKFNVLQNPNGILFDPASVADSIVSYIDKKEYTAEDLFLLNELWQSWDHHSRYSGSDQQQVLNRINESIHRAHDFLKDADWLIVTLGSAYSYRLTGQNMRPVANCHRAPGNWFDKHLMSADEVIIAMDLMLYRLFQFNRDLKVIFTISPVRHIRDGVINNNRSKARLIEAVHQLVNKFQRLYYFPAYELVIDVLRDYRFYDLDLVHPNYQATNFVLEQFVESFVDESSRELMKEVRQVVNARKHKAFHPSTEAHKKFMLLNAGKIRELLKDYPFLDLTEELEFFKT
jgi:hypothetical protein